MRLVPEEISFSGKCRLIKPCLIPLVLFEADFVEPDYLGLNTALYEWSESYDSKVRLPFPYTLPTYL